jgi:hypothetical protein
MNIRHLVAAAVLGALALPVYAADDAKSTRRIDARQKVQDKRIDRGVKSGALTDKEAARLDKGQARVGKMEERAVADGQVTARERARIEHAQDQQGRRIYREKHDKQTAK